MSPEPDCPGSWDVYIYTYILGLGNKAHNELLTDMYSTTESLTDHSNNNNFTND